MDPPDAAWSQDICLSLVHHDHEIVRGNAILGFGHLARISGELDQALVAPLVTAAMKDPSEYVRGQAVQAFDDISKYLGWKLPNE